MQKLQTTLFFSAIVLVVGLADTSQAAVSVYKGNINGSRQLNGGRFFESKVIEMGANVPHQIRVSSKSFNPMIILYGPSGRQLDFNDNIEQGNTSAGINFTPKVRGKYSILVTSYYPARSGDYFMRITTPPPVAPPPPPPPPQAKKLKLMRVEAVLGVSGRVDSAKVRHFREIFEFHSDPRKIYTITLNSRDFDTYLRIEDLGGKQITFDDDGGTFRNSKLVFDPARFGINKDQTIHIIVTSYQPAARGAFELELFEQKKN